MSASMSDHTNDDRRGHARLVIDAYAAECGPDEANLQDLLADLLHLCDDPETGWNFDEELRLARMHHDAERGR
jgi:hypothetical protein